MLELSSRSSGGPEQSSKHPSSSLPDLFSHLQPRSNNAVRTTTVYTSLRRLKRYDQCERRVRDGREGLRARRHRGGNRRSDRLIMHSSPRTPQSRIQSPKWLHLRRTIRDEMAAGVGFGSFPAARAPHHLLPTTSTFDHGCRFPTTESSRQYPLLIECRYRRHEPCEGSDERDPSQGHFWLRRHPSNNDQSKFSPLLRCPIPGSHSIRTPWPTNTTTSNLG